MILKPGVATHLCFAKILQCVTKKANGLLILEVKMITVMRLCVSRKKNGSLKVAQPENV
jgi:hypothetical protein